MNWFGLHIGDWLKKTQELTLLQEGVYLRLVCWCYAHELPLPIKQSEIHRIARANSRHEREAIAVVLRKYFELHDDGWHNGRCDEEIQKRGLGSTAARQHQAVAAERQKRYREKRHTLLSRLAAVGIHANASAPMREIEELCVTHNVTRDVTRDDRNALCVSHSQKTPAQPTTNNHTLRSKERNVCVTPGEPAVTPARAGAACLAMRRAGLPTTSPSDPRLLALLAAGVTDAELAITAQEASIRGKGFGWTLAAVAGRMRDAQQPTNADGPRGPLERAQSAAEASARAWAPTLFAQSDLERSKGSA